MPLDKGKKVGDQKSGRGMREATPTLTIGKFARRPPSLNRINKQLP